MIAWEYKTENEAIAKGRNPDLITLGQLWPDHIIEVEPTGPSSGDIVWEWHVWDHLIQDYDSSKDNYGDVADHPELIDINFGLSNCDWLHSNSIDYNEELDQILISVRNFNEIWVIDHSTTIEEAAGHSGGNSGKGGDILYRWGNPSAYRAGATSEQKFFFQHDARWINPGCPGEGNILVFNNGNGRPGPDYSSVDEIIPPIDEYGDYSYTPGSAYGPETPIWIYTAENPTDFYSKRMSGAQRLPNGNTLVCSTREMVFFEVTPDKETVWEYFVNKAVFKINTYALDYQGIQELFPEPYKPNIPDGPTTGRIGVNYTYTTNTTDPNGDQVYYWFDWGDDSNTGWGGPYNSGDLASESHIWNAIGDYVIKVKAKDNYDHESVWSDPLIVNIKPPNEPPYSPSNPDPLDGVTNVDVNAILSWTCSDPNGDDLVYDVYFEANDPTPDVLVSYHQSQPYYNPPGQMMYNTHYYWQIIAWDPYDASTTGPVWDFTTGDEPNDPPDPPSDPDPKDGATDVDVNAILSWTCSDPDGGDLFYDVYFEADDPEPDVLVSDDQTETTYDPGEMEKGVTYYWQIIAKDEHGASTIGPVWSFTTEEAENQPPNAPTITGENGDAGTSYPYDFVAEDPDLDDIAEFLVDWGDDNEETITGPFASGESTTKSHTFSIGGTFVITARAKDVNGLIGPEGSLTVKMPRSRTIDLPILKFLQNYPILFKIVQHLLGL